jgi:hypothetical protein
VLPSGVWCAYVDAGIMDHQTLGSSQSIVRALTHGNRTERYNWLLSHLPLCIFRLIIASYSPYSVHLSVLEIQSFSISSIFNASRSSVDPLLLSAKELSRFWIRHIHKDKVAYIAPDHVLLGVEERCIMFAWVSYLQWGRFPSTFGTFAAQLGPWLRSRKFQRMSSINLFWF